MKITKIKTNPNNPRFIKDEQFAKLVQSIKAFPKMMELRPIVVDHNWVIVGGNMRYKALLELDYKEIPDEWVKQAKDFSEDELKEFVIKDNLGFGEWDWDNLANNWNENNLQEWGLNIPDFKNVDYSDKNEEINIDQFDGLMTIKLTYNEDEYWQVKKQLSEIAATPEQAIWKILGNE